MSKAWTKVKLGEVLTKANEWIDLAADTTYREVTIRLWGKGVVLRKEVMGSEIASSRRMVVHYNQFILSRIDARNGAIGLVPEELDGAVVTNDFPAFNLDDERVEPSYLNWLSKTAGFVELCKAASEGTTNRVRLKEERFLALEIPLPSLPEQQRIVTRIEQLAAKIEEARGLRRHSDKEEEAFLSAEELKIWPDDALEGAPVLGNVTSYLARGRQSEQGESNHFLIKTQHVQMGKYVPTTLTLVPYVAERVLQEALVQQKDILIACSAAGCLGRVCFYLDNGKTASTDTHVAIARAASDNILPEYLYAFLKSAQGQLQLRKRERGDWTKEKVGFRLCELNLADLRAVPVPLPSLPEQRHIVTYLATLQAKLDSLKRLQSDTSTELDALMPSVLDKAFQGNL